MTGTLGSIGLIVATSNDGSGLVGCSNWARKGSEDGRVAATKARVAVRALVVQGDLPKVGLMIIFGILGHPSDWPQLEIPPNQSLNGAPDLGLHIPLVLDQRAGGMV